MEWLRCSSSSLRATAPRNVLAALPKSVHAGARRALNGPHLVALVRAGARFEAGRLVERPDEAVHDGPIHEVAA